MLIGEMQLTPEQMLTNDIYQELLSTKKNGLQQIELITIIKQKNTSDYKKTPMWCLYAILNFHFVLL